MENKEKYTIGYANAVIAKFMGYDLVVVGYAGTEEETEWQRNNEDWMDRVGIESVGRYIVNVKEDEWYPFEDINYHSSWDQLMPVVEKIESLENSRYGICIDTMGVIITDYKEEEMQVLQVDKYPDNEDTKISMTHDAVYQFILSYNQQKQTNEQH